MRNPSRTNVSMESISTKRFFPPSRHFFVVCVRAPVLLVVVVVVEENILATVGAGAC